MPKTLLLEAGFICLPDNVLATDRIDLREPVGQALRQEKFEFSRLRCWLSQHRIGILIEGLTNTQSGTAREIRGPKAVGAFDYNNLPSLAVQGFAAAQGVQYKDLITKEVDGEKYLFAMRPAAEFSLDKSISRIKDLVFASISLAGRPWSSDSRFVHPPLYFTAMLDDLVCDVELDGIKAGNVTASHDGLTIKYHVLSGAQFYPQVLQQIGVVYDLAERRKILEARIKSILPEGYMLRSEGARTKHLCCYKESLQPLLIKFKPDYLEMPETVLHRYMNRYFSLLACENNKGKMMPAAIAISEKLSPQTREAVVRSAELDQHLDRLLQVWRHDLATLPENLSKMASRYEKDGALVPEAGNSLFKAIVWLVPRLGLEKMAADINVVLALMIEAEHTQIAGILPSTGYSVIIGSIGEQPAFKKFVPILQEISDFVNGHIPTPADEIARVISLALLLRYHASEELGETAYPSLIINLLRVADYRLDIFQAFADIFPDFNLIKKPWLQAVAADIMRDVPARLLAESFMTAYELDPASFFAAVKAWKELETEDFEALSALYLRIRSKIEGGQIDQIEAAECEIEQEIASSLVVLEGRPGIDYQKIFEFFEKERVNIEACLMNLPPILDDTNPEHISRISLLQRLLRQLGRLPFIVKEKVSAKK